MARPKKPIDPAMVEKLATMGLSAELIGAALDVDHKTIERRFGPILKKGRQKRDGRLMVKLYQEAMGTPDKPGIPGKPCNTAIAIFLAKNWLGMTDRPDVVVNVQQNAAYRELTREELLETIRISQSVALEAPKGFVPRLVDSTVEPPVAEAG